MRHRQLKQVATNSLTLYPDVYNHTSNIMLYYIADIETRGPLRIDIHTYCVRQNVVQPSFLDRTL